MLNGGRLVLVLVRGHGNRNNNKNDKVGVHEVY